jgi:hypothetical protein
MESWLSSLDVPSTDALTAVGSIVGHGIGLPVGYQSARVTGVDPPLHPQVDIPISTPRPMSSRPPVRSVQVMSTATRDHPSGSLRVSDADRDRAIAELSEHYQAGRLTTEELEDRTGRALRARTAADLATLFADLPPRARLPRPRPAPPRLAAPRSAPGGTGPPVCRWPRSPSSAWSWRSPCSSVTLTSPGPGCRFSSSPRSGS